MISGCLALPARILGAVILVGLGYLAWINRSEVRRWIHRATADSAPTPAVAEASDPAERLASGRARLDSVIRRRVDSVVVSEAEATALVAAELERRGVDLADSIEVALADGEVTVRGSIDPSRLPPSALGPLSDWIEGRQRVSVRGSLGLLRLGTGEWRIERVTVRGLPLPGPLVERLMGLAVPGAKSSVTFPVDRRITGIRATPAGLVLYGGEA